MYLLIIENIVNFRCILWAVSKKEVVSILNNSVLEDGGIS